MSELERLKQFIRFEIDPAYFTDDDIECEEEFNVTYKPTYQDLVAACSNMIKAGIKMDVFETWYYFVSGDLAEYYEGMFEPAPDYGYLWPANDYDQFKAMDAAMDEFCIYDEFCCSQEEFAEALKVFISMADNYEKNRNLDPVDWKLTNIQKNLILSAFSGSTNNVSNSRKELFKKIVDEACENGDVLAMRIKGYGCYGGDKVFECDWEESRKWITKLFEQSGDPHYANTLGYIYYYGRCNGGVPEYEKAFQYYSVGAAHDLFESMYKIADMFLAGKGCIKSPETSAHIIHKIYDDSHNQFCYGEDANFADIALRWAAYFQRMERYTDALYHYLEADYAIKKRIKKSDFFGNKKVQEGITKGIQEAKEHIPAEYFKERVVTRNPYWLFDMIDRPNRAKFSIEHIEGNRYKMIVERRKKDHQGKALIVSPELECVTLTRKFESEFITDEPVIYKCTDKSNMLVTNISYSDENEYTFCNGETEIFTIRNADYILEKRFFD